MTRRVWLVVAALTAPGVANAQQIADSAFRPAILRPAFAPGAGPVVTVDVAHRNFHRPDGRYLTFAELLRRDGFVVRAGDQPWSAQSLAGTRVLVVANALHPSNDTSWVLPTPSAFTAEEIAAVRAWVEQGGSLFLIADHMPFAGAAEQLSAAFGVRYTNGFATDTTKREPLRWSRADGSLRSHPVTEGRATDERVDSVTSFTGSAFELPAGAAPLMVFGPAGLSLNPRRAWAFDSTTTRVSVGGWAQGAVLRVGRGRVAVFGEAAMFSAQLAEAQRVPFGMNSPVAAQNPQFLLNVVRWLAGVLQPE